MLALVTVDYRVKGLCPGFGLDGRQLTVQAKGCWLNSVPFSPKVRGVKPTFHFVSSVLRLTRGWPH